MALPSYHEATAKPNFWKTVAKDVTPYLTSNDLSSLCLVSHQFKDLFTPLLWHNPLKIIASGRNRRKERLVSFLLPPLNEYHEPCDLESRKFVEIVDFRELKDRPKFPVPLTVDEHSEVFLSNLAFESFPNVKFVIIDLTVVQFPLIRFCRGNPKPSNKKDLLWDVLAESSLESYMVARNRASNILFSADRCHFLLPEIIVHMAFCYSTLYMDLSYAENIDTFVKTASTERLSRLRILKLRRTGLTDHSLNKLGENFNNSLWSLDVCDNLLTVSAVGILEMHFPFVGKVPDRALPSNWMTASQNHMGSMVHDPRAFYLNGNDTRFDSNKWMAGYCSFSGDPLWNPNRYLVDPPTYTESTTHEGGQVPLAGNQSEFRPDTTDGVIKWFHDHPDSLKTYNKPHEIPDVLSKMTGLTHLYVSGNKLRTDRLFNSSRLQLLDCGLPTLKESALTSFYTWENFQIEFNDHTIEYKGRCKDLPFNVEVLRIHHSFITQTNILSDSNSLMGSRKRIELEEKSNLTTSCLGFRPNQNPKLRELILTDVPRKSLGRVINALKFLIHFAADQEVHLKHMFSSQEFSSMRSPKLLPGLRLIRLEFRQDEAKWIEGSATGDADAEAFINESAKDFSFFNDFEEDVKSPQSESERKDDMEGVLDVFEELKKYRQDTKARKIPSPYWTGELSIHF